MMIMIQKSNLLPCPPLMLWAETHARSDESDEILNLVVLYSARYVPVGFHKSSKLIFSKEPAIYGSSITIRRLPERYIFDVLLAPAPRKKQNGSQLYHVSET